MINQNGSIGVASRWMMRVALTAGTLTLWSFSRLFPPSPTFQGILLALSFLGGVFLALWGIILVCSQHASQRVLDAALGLGIVAAALAFLFIVLSNQEGPVSVVQAATGSTTHPDHLRIVDFNVLHGIPDFKDQEARFQDTLAAFRVVNPDLIVLQEAWDTSAHGNMAQRLSAALHLNQVYARANGSRQLLGLEEGSAILSRFPILEARRLLLAPRTPWWECRIALVATIDSGRRKLTIAGLHCHDQQEGVATAQAFSLLSRIDLSKAAIVAGDFNADSDSLAVTQFTDSGFMDVLPGGIDHLLLPRNAWGWKLSEVSWTFRPKDLEKLLGRMVAISDHPAIVADLVATE
jgi:endonuclease/exonuclease/phosphatase family metal-dependent hydrolase